MKVISARGCLVALVLVGGCRAKPPDPPPGEAREAEIRANLARLGPEDQRLAEQQKECPLMEGVRLGESGRPYKVTVKGVTTFVCCKSCVQEAQEDPDGALAKINEFERARAK